MSTLSAFPFIGEQSFATPGAINSPLSIISANIAAVNAAAGSVSGVTITPPSGNTITIASDLSVLGTMAAGPARLGVNSNLTNYLFLSDTSHARSNYVIGSQVGGTADGLNIWDDSGQTMIVSFSKQSTRFFQQVVGPVFDVGGALADTLNAATFGTGADSKESRIQAAISAATLGGIHRVYIPASMYPYSAASVSFDSRTQMVREGGRQDVYDVVAYGATGDGVADDTAAVQSALSFTPIGGTVFLPANTFSVNQVRTPSGKTLRITGDGTLKVRSAFDRSIADAVLYCQGQLTIENIVLDGNNQGRGLAYLGTGAANSLVRGITVKNVMDASGAGSTSGIYVAAPNCIIADIFAQQFSTGSQANQSIPRAVTFDSGSTGGIMTGLRGQVVNVIAVINAANVSIFDTVVSGASSDGFYCLAPSTGITLDGGVLYNVAQPFVFEGGARSTARNLVIVTDVALSGPSPSVDFAAQDIVIDNVRVYAPTQVVSLLNSRVNTSTISNVLIRNCAVVAGIDSSAPLAFSSGTVKDLRVENCYFEMHQLAAIVGEGRTVMHSKGDRVSYQNNTWRLVDDSATLTSANIFRTEMPTLTLPSFWGINQLLTDPNHAAQVVCQTAVGNFLNALGDPTQTQASAGYQREVGFNGSVGQRRVSSTAAPTAGTWSQGDVVLRTTPSSRGAAGFVCTAAGTPGTWLQFGHIDANVDVPSFASVTLNDGAAIGPSLNFSSDASLGLYRSGVSTIALSWGSFLVSEIGRTDGIRLRHAGSGNYQINNISGTFAIANASGALVLQTGGNTQLQIASGGTVSLPTQQFLWYPSDSAIRPGIATGSEISLGWYRSANSTLNLSYGTLDFTATGATLSVATLKVKAGANNSCGTAVLGSNGSVNVANTYIKTGDLIFLTDQTPGGTLGTLEVGGIRDSSGFTVQSTSVTDTSTVGWLIIRPG